MCLLEWFRKEHAWAHLFRLLAQLGQDSRWRKASFDDPEVAEEMAAAAVDKPMAGTWTPDNADWTLMNEQLAQLIELQKRHLTMISTTPHRKVEPFPRPITAYSKALERLQQEKTEAGLARIYDFVAEGQARWLADQQPGDGAL